MPLIKESSYQLPFFFRHGHVTTIYGGAFRKTTPPVYTREKLALADGDFLLIDYKQTSLSKAVILCHGLEGSSQSNYINSAAHYFLERHFSVFAWNNRSCGGAMNRLPQLYHHASIDDLAAVVALVLAKGFKSVYLVGFSMGGAQILNYLGEKTIDDQVKVAAAISSPIRLKASVKKIESGLSKLYGKRFIDKIKRKIVLKAEAFPQLLSLETVQKIRTLDDVARYFTVPIHGFKNLADYYQKVSPAFSLANIKTPTLLLNALDDPILGAFAYPVNVAENHPYLYLETPVHGGHCAFPLYKKPYSYADMRTFTFFERQAK